ncbi:peptidylprolyl isomerase [Streptomyces sp. JJ66]|uniref:peptidylprolyl isomerase n=1 Tax=Streptomyces sp. JJ66 TaxID=2803843 RepID=UPI001C5A1AC6|nr:peptidylprolyl isomerase [Streptomyces sp. JJ66]MBW1604158.1 peptidylprolyl isomerase [Streptomyces sp. JJ66]
MVSKEQRRRQLARQKYQRQSERRAAAQRRAKVRNTIVAVVLVVLVGGGGAVAALTLGGDDGQRTAGAAPSSSPSPFEDPCEQPAKGEPGSEQWEEKPELAIDTSASYTMTLETTCGDIEVALDAKNAPQTVNSFHFLTGENYFDHTRCHRLVDQGIYVLQCGDPQGTGQGGPGYELPDENLDAPEVKDGTYPAGTVAMANAGTGTGGSQFFLVYEDSPLPADYTPFGTITTGMDVLQKIAEAGSEPDPQIQATTPRATVVLNDVTVRES